MSFESEWWGKCINTFGEETKQLLYANRMGIKTFHDGKSPFNFIAPAKRILDIGGGPASMLLKCPEAEGNIVDPTVYPEWIYARYRMAGIRVHCTRAEDFPRDKFYDEAWIYNCLQHVDDPALVIANARKISRIVRIFEWIDIPASEGHPHTLTEEQLNKWLNGEGKTETLTGQNTCKGRCYYGIFKGDHA